MSAREGNRLLILQNLLQELGLPLREGPALPLLQRCRNLALSPDARKAVHFRARGSEHSVRVEIRSAEAVEAVLGELVAGLCDPDDARTTDMTKLVPHIQAYILSKSEGGAVEPSSLDNKIMATAMWLAVRLDPGVDRYRLRSMFRRALTAPRKYPPPKTGDDFAELCATYDDALLTFKRPREGC
jgi:hypothetical protein